MGRECFGLSPSPQCWSQCPVAADPSLCPACIPLSAQNRWESVLFLCPACTTLSAQDQWGSVLFLLLPAPPFLSPITSFPQSFTECPHLVFQGWTYAMDFPATYTRDKKWNSYVRRRRWIRYRRYKSRDTWAKVGACLWPGGGAGPTAVPLLGGSHGPSFLPSRLCTEGATPILGPGLCLLVTLWHCVSLPLGEGHVGRQARLA